MYVIQLRAVLCNQNCLIDYCQKVLPFFVPSLTVIIFALHTCFLLNFGLYDISFYTAAPLSLCCTFAPEVFKFATNWMEEFIVKGKNQMAVAEFDAWGFIYPLMRQRWYTWIGAAIFCWGWVHQRCCHAILVSFVSSHSSSLIFVCLFSYVLIFFI